MRTMCICFLCTIGKISFYMKEEEEEKDEKNEEKKNGFMCSTHY